MLTSDLEFDFPSELVATEPQRPTRVMWCRSNDPPKEITIDGVIDQFSTGDILVVNNTEVMKRRVFNSDGFEVLFLAERPGNQWQVLMPLRSLKKKTEFPLPGGVTAKLVERGRPQVIEVSQKLDLEYFKKNGEIPLPPYIQKARGERKPVDKDDLWYQTSWAKTPGSLAAPTAGLHFQAEHIQALKDKGVEVLQVTLHVGLGTFMEVAVEDLDEHQMHYEEVEVTASVWQKIEKAKDQGRKVWALGTTVTRTLESVARNMIEKNQNGDFVGATDLFLLPGKNFHVVDVLMTNFHQPRSTLLALVGAFAGLEQVKKNYAWAIDKKFRLFSYGDLSVWSR